MGKAFADPLAIRKKTLLADLFVYSSKAVIIETWNGVIFAEHFSCKMWIYSFISNILDGMSQG